jgi:GxxExxY protein
VVELAHGELTGKIIGAFYDLFAELGHGFGEHVYRRALCVLLRERGHQVVEEPEIVVFFHGIRVGTFRPDLVVDGIVLVEFKAARQLEPRDEAQTLNYLKSAGGGVGLLVNFGPQVTYKRLVMGDPYANLPNLALPTPRSV